MTLEGVLFMDINEIKLKAVSMADKVYEILDLIEDGFIKNKMDLALQVSIGSSTQIAMFVAPVLVLISLFFHTQMSLIFNTFELAAIIFSVLIVNAIVQDGESNWFEGVQLLIAYSIIAVAFYFNP